MGHPFESSAVPIHRIRNRQVILDFDLARMFGVSTKRLNEQIRRNSSRFPEDFAFQLTAAEAERLRSHFATSKKSRGGNRFLPFALTEHGVVMAANVLKSERAVTMSVEVVRAFVRLRRAITVKEAIYVRISELERVVGKRLDRHDREIETILKALDRLIETGEEPEEKTIGFLRERPE
ncbi:MAG: DNA-binding protein [Elusimicrobia bacterium CG_4_9_14_3_um_filter_62_55]|nr:MAG: DNA-binding protein [Elusimicrobia bacterium CG22_combo_CG10-13_8_21_14_all_63_91]PJA17138.1 MAG: DNA-binding protein [Elusimicrobia bacterium CG_4_10_14_0_2_um_filter_63_34]PJB25515.1 MAG: DNA-binding protein [Elusimicrobia bacterium CG_4_9_14_3_um_filter_62_55]